MPTKERKLESFIAAFIAYTEPLGAPIIFRRWTAISLLAATVEQKVWIQTSRPLHPNLYTFLVAHPGVGKTRVISEGRHLAFESGAVHLAPVSMTFPSLVDALLKAKREVTRMPEGNITYNSMYITADELGAFMHKYDPEMIDGLSAFYDTTPYSQERRTSDLKIKIQSPQLNVLAGSTPQNLLGFLPERAWGQGFTSRTIMVFSDERIRVDDFAQNASQSMDDLLGDLKTVSTLYGKFHVTEAYRSAVNTWRDGGEAPVPAHPRLTHYITRRRVQVYKLSMVASLDRDNGLALTEADFFTALGWLVDAERSMEDIFKAGATNSDAAAMDEIVHYIKVSDLGPGVAERHIVKFARERVPITSILRIVEIMESGGMIHLAGTDRRSGERYFKAGSPISNPSSGPAVRLVRPAGLQ